MYGPDSVDWKPERRMRFAKEARVVVEDKLARIRERNKDAKADVENGGLHATVTVTLNGLTKEEQDDVIVTLDRVYAQIMTHDRK